MHWPQTLRDLLYCQFFTDPDTKKKTFFFCDFCQDVIYLFILLYFVAIPFNISRLFANTEIYIWGTLDNLSMTADRVMCNQQLWTVDRWERFMSAVKVFVATSILYFCCACNVFYSIIVLKQREDALYYARTSFLIQFCLFVNMIISFPFFYENSINVFWSGPLA